MGGPQRGHFKYRRRSSTSGRHYTVTAPTRFYCNVTRAASECFSEVNDKPVSSKTMLKYYILESIVKNKKINFLVECPAGDAYRDCCDMAPDVTDIALKQIERFKKTLNQMPSKSVYTSHRSKNSVSIAPTERTEVEIPADFDPTKLRPCKNAK